MGESPFGVILYFRSFGLPSICSTDSEMKALLHLKVLVPRSDNQCKEGNLVLGKCLQENLTSF